jgi:4-amino-4-deoxy-L-arabinose transferase-like glycosyltransferase
MPEHVHAEPVRWKIILTLAGLWLLLYASFTLFSPPLLDDADSVHAEVAREMVARHDWITLYANGIRYLEKAPLMYWSMAASFTLFGPQDWAARLPLAIATLALFLDVYATGRRLCSLPDTAGFYAALILLTSFGIFIYTRIIHSRCHRLPVA